MRTDRLCDAWPCGWAGARGGPDFERKNDSRVPVFTQLLSPIIDTSPIVTRIHGGRGPGSRIPWVATARTREARQRSLPARLAGYGRQCRMHRISSIKCKHSTSSLLSPCRWQTRLQCGPNHTREFPTTGLNACAVYSPWPPAQPRLSTPPTRSAVRRAYFSTTMLVSGGRHTSSRCCGNTGSMNPTTLDAPLLRLCSAASEDPSLLG